MRTPGMTDKALREMNERTKLEIEAIDILKYVDSEFRRDPKSVQCFDLRQVERIKNVIARLKELSVF